MKDPFVPSASFAGARQGYHFKMGLKGLGYYREAEPSAAESAGQPQMIVWAERQCYCEEISGQSVTNAGFPRFFFPWEQLHFAS